MIDTETKPTKAIVGFIGTLATSLIATAADGWTTEELALSALGAVVAAAAVYGFRNAPVTREDVDTDADTPPVVE